VADAVPRSSAAVTTSAPLARGGDQPKREEVCGREETPDYQEHQEYCLASDDQCEEPDEHCEGHQAADDFGADAEDGHEQCRYSENQIRSRHNHRSEIIAFRMWSTYESLVRVVNTACRRTERDRDDQFR
jgi:hypothetical protein